MGEGGGGIVVVLISFSEDLLCAGHCSSDGAPVTAFNHSNAEGVWERVLAFLQTSQLALVWWARNLLNGAE